jgi:hypothetical protein
LNGKTIKVKADESFAVIASGKYTISY